jgi:hypothetical protein
MRRDRPLADQGGRREPVACCDEITRLLIEIKPHVWILFYEAQ